MPKTVTATEYGFEETICTKSGNFYQYGLEDFYNTTEERTMLEREFYGVIKRKLKVEDRHIDTMLEGILGEAPDDAEFDNVEDLYAAVHKWNDCQSTWDIYDEDRETIVTVSDEELAELMDMSVEEVRQKCAELTDGQVQDPQAS